VPVDFDSDAAFSIETRPDDGVLVLHGELDVASAPVLAATAALVDDAPGDLRIDVSDLRFCGSVGLSCLVTLYKRRVELGAGLVLIGPRPNIKRVLVTTGLDSLFEIEE
jgi:anti-sigma B factor antagonist